MSPWLDSLTAWLAANPQWLALALFLIACLECLAIAGIIVPGTVLLFAVAVLAGNGALGLWQTLALAYCGGLLGDALSYATGRYFHQDIRRLPGLRQHPQWLAGAEGYFQRYGVASLLVGRFIGPLRPMLPMIAGMVNMPLGRFIPVSLVAAAGWAVAYLLPGWATGAALRLPLPPGFWPQALLLAGGLGLLLVLSAHCSLQGYRRSSLLAAGLSLALLLGLVLGWPHLSQLDQGLLALLQEQRSASLDEPMVLVTRLGDFATQLAAALLLCLLLLLARQWRPALLAGAALLATALANAALKQLFARQRPEVLLEPLSSFSFPSGHSSAAFAFFLLLGILAGRGQPPRLRLAWLLLASLPAVAIALSRVYLGVHWPSDIIAGALLAAGICGLALGLTEWRTPLAALPAKVWWLVLPGCLALLGSVATWQLSEGLLLYRY
ncbi:bifunctional DedA family/phosphatase PAP2 family protein [Pseudomonas lalucatii]|uniref:Bifunctional DedA family/phosphatase PAP2 family protein n=1 Tax=Pseudomonas lalucatii TaxID=1424203 RepID=A0ABS5Q6Y3_9PSED|nr:bifunctional DedA family/phosphatase PAP2 family protein [Pseudomonas lalucatii]MBS7664083.1 bifunctional DedA family/phosphatase PAP2 family protein [Pseudomonas lalucatii]MBS7690852.1 bifunctional DedA family/phosphatase PAP2 family protein [Pseudomonas lalucatii]MBS7725410.1 bifunctional DedA family/phosphatase PAP2 family protein [Pseudomonas lalucatii]QVM86648.1 bifunctional DedA family/phosphatase PAP2 family protein [Pseudomonas lalucatii]